MCNKSICPVCGKDPSVNTILPGNLPPAEGPQLLGGSKGFLIIEWGGLFACTLDPVTLAPSPLRLLSWNVASAAVSGKYYAYVTTDGRVHLDGPEDPACCFTGFRKAKQIFATHDDTFYILGQDGKTYAFGNNRSKAVCPGSSEDWISTPMPVSVTLSGHSVPALDGTMPVAYDQELPFRDYYSIKKLLLCPAGDLLLIPGGGLRIRETIRIRRHFRTRVLTHWRDGNPHINGSWTSVLDIAVQPNGHFLAYLSHSGPPFRRLMYGHVSWLLSNKPPLFYDPVFPGKPADRLIPVHFCPACGRISDEPGSAPASSRKIQLFSNNSHLYFLTDGNLYAFRGKQNRYDFSKIEISDPCLLARHVTAAAADCNCIYVTADGQVHLDGNNELADRFTGFGNARNVYVSYSCGEKRFYIVDRKDQVFAFGSNQDGFLQKPDCRVIHTFPQVSAEDSSALRTYRPITDHNRIAHQSWEYPSQEQLHEHIKEVIRNTPEYCDALRCHGHANIRIEIADLTVRNGKTHHFSPPPAPEYRPGCYNGCTQAIEARQDLHLSASARILVENKLLFSPVPAPESVVQKLLNPNPFFEGSMPIDYPEEYLQGISGIRKIVTGSGGDLLLCNNGHLYFLSPQEKTRLNEHQNIPAHCWKRVLAEDGPVQDVAITDNAVLCAMENGTLLYGLLRWL